MPGMRTQTTGDRRAALGRAGELAVREEVARRGWTVADYNVRWRDGELDLVALDRRTLVFAEVKTLVARPGSRAPAFSPFESITRKKQLRIRALARRWIIDRLSLMRRESELRFDAIRFDAFAVTMQRDHTVTRIEHLEDAF